MLKQNIFAALGASVVFSLSALPANALDRRDEQNDARAQMMAGKVKSLRSIENSVLPRMSGSEYLGPEFDPSALIYRLKFIRNGRVIFIDVDGRTGAIVRQSR